MAAINFPDSPSNGDTHVVGGVTYTYDSTETKWKTTINSNAFLPLSGGTVSGNIVLGGEIQHDGDTDTKIHFDTDTIKLDTGGSTRATVDSSGRLLVGTSSALDKFGSDKTPRLQVEGTTQADSSISITRWNVGNTAPPILLFGGTNSNTSGVYTLVDDDENLGQIRFEGTDGSKFVAGAAITAAVDGTPGANDMPGRLVFSTTADGASSPTERMRLKSDGVLIATNTSQTTSSTPSEDSTFNSVAIRGAQGQIQISAQNTTAFDINRRFSDGTLVNFRGDGTVEGTISISGTTISYNGGHLSRWSQLPGGTERTEILRGSVLSNIDEMCNWGEEENEQLNRMKVSDVEGDPNVSGVFQGWDDDDDAYTDDFYCAMTGDFVIRIAQGVTVERGDLLMSAGDGTAKPQDDDIIRSKTIAKVTSTNVSCIYDDGSYCVPCVLMAC